MRFFFSASPGAAVAASAVGAAFFSFAAGLAAALALGAASLAILADADTWGRLLSVRWLPVALDQLGAKLKEAMPEGTRALLAG